MESQEPAGDLIRRTRSRLGYSQYAVAAELVRVSGNTSLTREDVSRWERGKRIPGPYWRQWISRVLDLRRAELDAAAHMARTVRVTRRSQAGARARH